MELFEGFVQIVKGFILLLLTRKNHQSIIIGTNIVVTVLEIEGGRIKVGIDAPQECRIVREDARCKVQKHNAMEPGLINTLSLEPG